MRFLKRWKLKRSGFRPIAVYQAPMLQQRFLAVHRKPCTILKHVQQVHHQHVHTSYQMKLSLVKQETMPITFLTIPQPLLCQPMKQHLVLQRTWLSKQHIQDIGDEVLRNSIRKEREFYKYHPALAAKLANDLLASTTLLKERQKSSHPVAYPAFFQLLPQQVVQQIPLMQKMLPAPKKKEEQHIMEEKQELRIIELQQIIKEVYAQMETWQQRSKRRKGRM